MFNTKGMSYIASSCIAASAVLLPAVSVLLPADASLAAGDTDKSSKPNIVFIMCDDGGAREFGCYGNTFNETPNIDRLAQQGMLFNQAYAAQPVCSPTRASLFSGRYPTSTGITEFFDNTNSDYLDPDKYVTINEMLGKAGYRTGILGKWHLCAGYDNYPTKGAPVFHGFDEVLLSEQRYIGGGFYFPPYKHLPQVKDSVQGEYLVERMNREAVSFIERNKDKPFALFLTHYAVHTELDAPKDLVDYFNKKRGTPGDKNSKTENPYLAAMFKTIDNGVGQISNKLEELGLSDNTILVVYSDNGGVFDNKELRGGKRKLLEGGIREPLIIRWPSKIKPGSVSNVPVSTFDFYPTFAEAAGYKISGGESRPAVSLPAGSNGQAQQVNYNRTIIQGIDGLQKLDGQSMIPVLEQKGSLNRDTLIWNYPRFLTEPNNFTEGGVIRKGDYKYLESYATGEKKLYNIKDDPSEIKDISRENQALKEQLSLELHERISESLDGVSFHAGFDNNEYYRWVVSGKFAQQNSKYISITPGKESTSLCETKFFTDSEAEADVSVGATGKAGLIMRGNNFNTKSGALKGYYISLSAETKELFIDKLDMGKSTRLSSASVSIEPNKSYRLKAVADKNKILVYLDGSEKPILQCEDNSYSKGTVGLRAVNTTASFDKLDVSAIYGKQTEPQKEAALTSGSQNGNGGIGSIINKLIYYFIIPLLVIGGCAWLYLKKPVLHFRK